MNHKQKIQDSIKGILERNTRQIAKAISFVENHDYSSRKDLLKSIFNYTGSAVVIGITGSPGAGKSTLVDKLVQAFREDQLKIAVLAVDPSSPFTKGAFLGDRIRMQNHTLDPFVYMRSMASRGALGGLSPATKDAIKILDAAGFDIIIVETVGVGQSEIDIVKIADCVVLVFAPGFGDEIQAMKSGVMEIADIYVVNKADRDFSQKLFKEISDIINFSNKIPKPILLKTIAINTYAQSNVEDLKKSIYEYLKFMRASDNIAAKRKQSLEQELIETIKNSIIDKILLKKNIKRILNEKVITEIYNKELNLYEVIDNIMEEI